MKNTNTEELSEKNVIKSFINGFVAYGIIFTFIFIVFSAILNWIFQYKSFTQDTTFIVINSILEAIIFYILILFICRISTFDVLKKHKIKKENLDSILKTMKKFFLICGVFSIMVCSLNLSVKFLNLKNNLSFIKADNFNSFSDKSIATALTEQEITKFKNTWFKYELSSGIKEIAILLSCLYLITYQKKMILIYNEKQNK